MPAPCPTIAKVSSKPDRVSPAHPRLLPVAASLSAADDEVFRRLVDSVRDYAIFMMSPTGVIASWNAGAQRIKGYDAADVIGKHFSIFYTADANAADWPAEELRRAQAQGHFEDEGWRVRKDGSRFWANVSISPVRDAAGALMGFSKVTRDLTERREHERRLTESERNLRLLVEGVQDYAIFTLDKAGFITSWNQGARRIKGYAAEEAIGRHFSMFYRKEDVDRGWPQEELSRAEREGKFEDEGWRLRKDGTLIWANVIITALRDERGHLLGFSKVTRDLTQRRQHEEELRQREEDFRLLVEGVKDHAMFLVDADGCIRTWNAGAQRMLGFSSGQVLGQPTTILSTPEDRGADQFQAGLAAARAIGHLEVEAWRQRADGKRIRVEVATTEVRDDRGHVRGFVQIMHDLTDRQRVEALETQGRRISEFIAMLSHELRNPLAPIRNAVAILQRFVDKPETVWCAELIGRQVNHMSRLVDDLLDVGRITNGKIRLEVEPVDLHLVVAQAVESMRPTVVAYGHSLSLVLASAPLGVSGDVTRLTQVFVNLLTNAAKYTPPPGKIEVRVAAEEGGAVVRVRDSGIGLPQELLERAFEPFVQGARALARSEGGLGLGLTLVRSVVELHGGSVTAESDGPGQGTTFTVRLPCGSPVEPAPPPAIETATPGRARVLVVDDNADAAQSIAMLLRMNGHEVEVACDGEQALELAARQVPDVAFLDIGLPGMDGYEVARRLQEMPGLQGVRLIAVTGYGQAKDKEAARAAGFHLHVTKPIEPGELVKLVTA